ncbi:unnamed protein product [Bursaphelenchus xylophilus]|uniref:(pine wood nematode) hypothetical protein n=1 Tax=Bursaphelenchus xylophilus TaxID=6326 RepID=A0A1I7RVR7_BURXY|nr:unnamed protein product [Bursaphelenchus xylophilus]CAG9082053.1 unnamed protein product [Bursaphelenchus xylophilus]
MLCMFLLPLLFISVDSHGFHGSERCKQCIPGLKSSRILAQTLRRYNRLAPDICNMELLLIDDSVEDGDSVPDFYAYHSDADLIGWSKDLVDNPAKRHVALLSYKDHRFLLHEKFILQGVEEMPQKYEWRHITFNNVQGFVIVVKAAETIHLFTCGVVDLEFVYNNLYSFCEHFKARYKSRGIPTSIDITEENKLKIFHGDDVQVWNYKRAEKFYKSLVPESPPSKKGFAFDGGHLGERICTPKLIQEYKPKYLEDYPFVNPSERMIQISQSFRLCELVGNCPKPCLHEETSPRDKIIDVIAMFLTILLSIITSCLTFGYCFFCIGVIPPFFTYVFLETKSRRLRRELGKGGFSSISINEEEEEAYMELKQRRSPEVKFPIATPKQRQRQEKGVHVSSKKSENVKGLGKKKALADEKPNKESKKEEKTQMKTEVNVVHEIEVKQSEKSFTMPSSYGMDNTQGESVEAHDLTTTTVEQVDHFTTPTKYSGVDPAPTTSKFIPKSSKSAKSSKKKDKNNSSKFIPKSAKSAKSSQKKDKNNSSKFIPKSAKSAKSSKKKNKSNVQGN